MSMTINMPQRTLLERRPWLLGSLAAAIFYYFMRNSAMPGLYLIGWKGAAVGFLAIYALLYAPGINARILAVAMALAACGDMALEIDAFWAGLCFFASQLVLISLFLRNPREMPSRSQKLTALALLLLVPLLAHNLAAGIHSAPTQMGVGTNIFFSGLATGAVAATAWASRFPRYRTGLGAVLAVCAFLLLLAAQGPLAGSRLPYLLGWPLYYAGQFLICTGVTLTLRRNQQA